MPIEWVGEVADGYAQSASNQVGSIVLTVPRTIPARRFLVLSIGHESSYPSTITDSRGNTWDAIIGDVGYGGQGADIYGCFVAVGKEYGAGDTITLAVTLAIGIYAIARIDEFRNANGTVSFTQRFEDQLPFSNDYLAQKNGGHLNDLIFCAVLRRAVYPQAEIETTITWLTNLGLTTDPPNTTRTEMPVLPGGGVNVWDATLLTFWSLENAVFWRVWARFVSIPIYPGGSQGLGGVAFAFRNLGSARLLFKDPCTGLPAWGVLVTLHVPAEEDRTQYADSNGAVYFEALDDGDYLYEAGPDFDTPAHLPDGVIGTYEGSFTINGGNDIDTGQYIDLSRSDGCPGGVGGIDPPPPGQHGLECDETGGQGLASDSSTSGVGLASDPSTSGVG